ncbi:ABC transporter permease [Aquiluna borgnonia]|uniref:Cell division protein FtsX n=1 Tax=Aquiluna borgnonia TaxID=2499157 RepID=A0A7D4PQ94_9MICO|nr:permease-like cell division protein FtsX [Aquiluna borgnonia]QKJ24761.1 ABC transporter permease [Aquiluna borgnonia]
MKLGFILSEMWAGIRSNLSMIISIILVSFVSLTFLAVTLLLQLQITQMKTYWYDRAQVAVYLCSDFSPEEACPAGGVTETQKIAIKQQLQSDVLSPYIEEFYFESKDDAYTKFIEQFADSQAAQYITAEQLNEAYWVNLKDPTQSELIVESFSGLDGVEEIKDQRSYLDEIFSFLNAGSLLAGGVAAVMLLSATLLIATTIRLSAHSRRREISIMRLVGASKFSIQLPFVLEGLLAAVMGGALASAVTVAITHYFVTGFLAQQLAFTSFFTVADALMITPYLIGVGSALAILSSALSIHRYLRT